jgi:hypothetical protein
MRLYFPRSVSSLFKLSSYVLLSEFELTKAARTLGHSPTFSLASALSSWLQLWQVRLLARLVRWRRALAKVASQRNAE